jgi:hypothetical protein
MKSTRIVRVCVMVLFSCALIPLTTAYGRQPQGWHGPTEGYVPDAATAKRVAEAVWIPLLGAGRIAREKPFRARLHGDIWTVTGTFPYRGPVGKTSLGWVIVKGGVAEAKISKWDGRIISLSHGR